MNTPEEQESICQEAHRIQGGDRKQAYGHPRVGFKDVAMMWEAYCKVAHPCCGLSFTPEDVANMMILLKIVRNNHKPKRDGIVDIAGYAQCLAEIQGL